MINVVIILNAMLLAAAYALAFAAKKYVHPENEKSPLEFFDLEKIGYTVIAGAIVGGIYAWYGLPITADGITGLFTDNSVMMVSIVVLQTGGQLIYRCARNVWKILYRKYPILAEVFHNVS